MMRDLDLSINFNFSRQCSNNGWQNFDDNEPPRPPASIYNCIESDQEDQADVREVEYVQNETEAKHVNSKQYERMMKRRIKKVIS